MGFRDNAARMVETDEGYRSLVRLVTIRKMLRDRGIRVEELSTVTGKSVNYLIRIITGSTYFRTVYFDKALDIVDQGITQVTDLRASA